MLISLLLSICLSSNLQDSAILNKLKLNHVSQVEIASTNTDLIRGVNQFKLNDAFNSSNNIIQLVRICNNLDSLHYISSIPEQPGVFKIKAVFLNNLISNNIELDHINLKSFYSLNDFILININSMYILRIDAIHSSQPNVENIKKSNLDQLRFYDAIPLSKTKILLINCHNVNRIKNCYRSGRVPADFNIKLYDLTLDSILSAKEIIGYEDLNWNSDKSRPYSFNYNRGELVWVEQFSGKLRHYRIDTVNNTIDEINEIQPNFLQEVDSLKNFYYKNALYLKKQMFDSFINIDNLYDGQKWRMLKWNSDTTFLAEWNSDGNNIKIVSFLLNRNCSMEKIAEFNIQITNLASNQIIDSCNYPLSNFILGEYIFRNDTMELFQNRNRSINLIGFSKKQFWEAEKYDLNVLKLLGPADLSEFKLIKYQFKYMPCK